MEDREQLRARMKAAAANFETPAAACPTTDELIGHYRRTLEAARREYVESHLMQCPACREKLRDVADFFDAPRESEEQSAPADVSRQFEMLWPKLQTGRRPAVLHPRWMLALAACLTLALALSAMWSLRVGRQEMAWESRLREVEEANRRLRQQSDSERQQIVQLQAPQLNTAIHDVFSTQSLARAAGPARRQRIAVAAGKPYTLILNGEGVRALPDYALEILDPQGRSVWKAQGLRRGALGNFIITLNGNFLPAGEYKFRLSGKTNNGYDPIMDYLVTIERLS